MTVLDIQTAKEISELLAENKSLEDIRKSISHHGGTINAWIIESLFSNNTGGPSQILRNAIIDRFLKDRIVVGMLRAAESPSEKTTRKSVILSELSKADRALLERDGHEAFIEQVKDAVLLKVEETVEILPPQINLYKEILKVLGNGETENTEKKLMDFTPVHKDLPEV